VRNLQGAASCQVKKPVLNGAGNGRYYRQFITKERRSLEKISESDEVSVYRGAKIGRGWAEKRDSWAYGSLLYTTSQYAAKRAEKGSSHRGKLRGPETPCTLVRPQARLAIDPQREGRGGKGLAGKRIWWEIFIGLGQRKSRRRIEIWSESGLGVGFASSVGGGWLWVLHTQTF